MDRIKAPVLREAVFEDMASVQELKHAVGFCLEDEEDWDWLWRNNPAWNSSSQQPTMGWVLEVDDRIVGYIASVPTLIHYKGKTLLAATASGYAVDHGFRGHGLRLAAAFLKQQDIDILLNTTATEASGEIFQRFKAIPMPQENYGKVLFWVLRPREFIGSALRHKRCPTVLARFASLFLSVFLRSDIVMRKKKPSEKSGTTGLDIVIRQVDVSAIGDEFDDLWSRKAQEERRLISNRSADVLRWHFAKTRATVLCCDISGKLAGYAVVTREDLVDTGLARSKLVDIFVERDDPEVVDQLLLGAYKHAKADGSHVLEIIGFPAAIRNRVQRANPYSRTLRHWPFFYTAIDHRLHAELQDQEAWYACAFDGDTSIF